MDNSNTDETMDKPATKEIIYNQDTDKKSNNLDIDEIN
jgi:hypothetical protein